ncbi:MAG: FG-GAP repeat protein, partial [Phycisphaerales bacterium]|nr:FG-GAP repeat protein [Phycisphaerales bacterium]
MGRLTMLARFLIAALVPLAPAVAHADGDCEQKLTAGDAAVEDYFGYSVSIDGSYAIVGAYGNDDDGGKGGSAYIFRRSGGTWTQQQKLTA